MAYEKMAQAVELPLIPEQKAIITNQEGQPAQTSVQEIVQIMYNEQYSCLYISFRTKNSLYTAPVVINRNPNYIDGQIIASGRQVYTQEGYITIEKIARIETDKIVVISQGLEYSSPISLYKA